MQKTKREVLILCEGDSERAYIKELGRILRDKDAPVSLHDKGIDTGHFTEVRRRYKEHRKGNPRSEIIIWIDFDIYKRNDKQNHDKLMGDRNSQGKDRISDHIKFNHMNFEDFLILHLEDDKFAEWQRVCSEAGHCQSPLHDEDYRRLYRQRVFPSYEKGELPFRLGMQHLINLKRHCTAACDCPGSEFGTWLLDEVLGGIVL